MDTWMLQLYTSGVHYALCSTSSREFQTFEYCSDRLQRTFQTTQINLGWRKYWKKKKVWGTIFIMQLTRVLDYNVSWWMVRWMTQTGWGKKGSKIMVALFLCGHCRALEVLESCPGLLLWLMVLVGGACFVSSCGLNGATLENIRYKNAGYWEDVCMCVWVCVQSICASVGGAYVGVYMYVHVWRVERVIEWNCTSCACVQIYSRVTMFWTILAMNGLTDALSGVLKLPPLPVEISCARKEQ